MDREKREEIGRGLFSFFFGAMVVNKKDSGALAASPRQRLLCISYGNYWRKTRRPTEGMWRKCGCEELAVSVAPNLGVSVSSKRASSRFNLPWLGPPTWFWSSHPDPSWQLAGARSAMRQRTTGARPLTDTPRAISAEQCHSILRRRPMGCPVGVDRFVPRVFKGPTTPRSMAIICFLCGFVDLVSRASRGFTSEHVDEERSIQQDVP